jgi:hypothetical protein
MNGLEITLLGQFGRVAMPSGAGGKPMNGLEITLLVWLVGALVGAVVWFVWPWIVEGRSPLPKVGADAPAGADTCEKCGCGLVPIAGGLRCPECGHEEEFE